MPYLLDTGIVIDHLAGDADVTALVAHLLQDGTAISVVTYMEVWEGVLASPETEEARRGFEEFVRVAPIAPFSLAVARRCAALRDALRREGKSPRRRALDLIVAATAMEYGLTLVTRNVDDYRDIPDLRLQPVD